MTIIVGTNTKILVERASNRRNIKHNNVYQNVYIAKFNSIVEYNRLTIEITAVVFNGIFYKINVGKHELLIIKTSANICTIFTILYSAYAVRSTFSRNK